MAERTPRALDPFSSLQGADRAFRRVIETARGIAETDVGVLIRGETGTGKDLLARGIHDASRRREGPLVLVHCGILRDDLPHSELFGPPVDLPIGAIRDQPGLVAAAHRGTLVLDEIGDLSLPDQDRLRSFIDSSRGADVRLIVVTHRDLERLAREGRFRSELLYRLQVVTLDLPPLRRRPNDVEYLFKFFCDELGDRYSKKPPRYSAGAIKALRRHSWPGNVRELRNFCEQLVLTFPGHYLRAEDVPLAMRFPGEPQRDAAQLPAGGIRLDDWIEDFIRQSLAQAGGNRSQAARLLGITRDTLNYRIKKYGITFPS